MELGIVGGEGREVWTSGSVIFALVECMSVSSYSFH